ncbi:PAS domain-containing protein [Devosia soli]|nr:PAS domain-containing protein [Devosia soli]
MADRNPAARSAEEWVKVAETSLGLGFWHWEASTAKLACSLGLYALTGVNPAGVQLDLAFLESLVHPADRLVVQGAHGLATDTRQASRQFRLIRPDGQLRWLHGRANTFFDREGAITRVVAVVSDVTEQREADARLARKRALLQNLSALVDGVFWIADNEGQLVDVFAADPVVSDIDIRNGGIDWRASMHPDDLDRLATSWKRAIDTKKRYDAAPRLRRANGEYQQFHIAGLPLYVEHSLAPLWAGLATPNPQAITSAAYGLAYDLALTAGQVRACRALLDWNAEALAKAAGVSLSTIRRIEASESGYLQGESMRLVTKAFRNAGLKIWRGEDGKVCITDRD